METAKKESNQSHSGYFEEPSNVEIIRSKTEQKDMLNKLEQISDSLTNYFSIMETNYKSIQQDYNKIQSIVEQISNQLTKMDEDLVSLKKKRERSNISSALVDSILNSLQENKNKLEHITNILDASEIA